jgi:glycosyltransferase involved in cell wall biosynthesis
MLALPSSAAPLRDGPDNLWIVIPAYNEGPRLKDTLQGLCGRYPHIVVVDDGSGDDTGAAALGCPVWLLRHVVNCGQGAALQTGIDFALRQGADIIVTFDADGQHSADEIDRLVEPVRSGHCDVALGSRFLGEAIGLVWTRWLVLKLGVLFTRVFSRIHVTDTHNGLRAFNRRAAGAIRITQNRMAHASEILDQIRLHGLRFTEVPVTIRYTDATREKGQSSWNAVRIVWQLVLGRLVR